MEYRPRVIAAVSKNSGRRVIEFLTKRGENLTDVFVLDEKYAIPGTGFKTFDDLIHKGSKTRLHKVRSLEDHVDTIRAANPDVLLMNWSEVLGEYILSIPKRGVAGFHYSKLPDRRGANPAVWAMLHGLPKSEVTFHYYTPEIDKGDVIDTEGYMLPDGAYHDEVMGNVEGAMITILDRSFDAFKNGTAPRKKIDFTKGSIYTPKLGFKDGRIAWGRETAESASRRVRAFAPPFAGAYSYWKHKGDSQKLYILRADAVEEGLEGRVIDDWKNYSARELHGKISDGALYAPTGKGYLKITQTRLGGPKE